MSEFNTAYSHAAHRERKKAGKGELTMAEGMVVQAARAALVKTIEKLLPDGANPRALKTVAFAGGFGDVLTGLAVSGLDAGVVAIVNRQLEQSGWELVPVARN